MQQQFLNSSVNSKVNYVFQQYLELISSPLHNIDEQVQLTIKQYWLAEIENAKAEDIEMIEAQRLDLGDQIVNEKLEKLKDQQAKITEVLKSL